MKQIVGGTLGSKDALKTNFVSDRSAAWYAELYKRDKLLGGHIIMLGPGNESQAGAALAAYPGGMQIGGGINSDNAAAWLNQGASHVIVTSWVFPNRELDWDRLHVLARAIGKNRLVLDLSCRKRDDEYVVVTDRWRTFTKTVLGEALFKRVAGCCAELLVHAVDVEGLCRGVDEDLVTKLAEWAPLPVTYAGGATSLGDLDTVYRLGRGNVHLTIGSALDIFGGSGVRYSDVVAWNNRLRAAAGPV